MTPAALRSDLMDAPWGINGAMNRDLFNTYIETQLAPTLEKGDVVILDNLSSHKSTYAAGVLRYSAEVSADGAGITTIVPINKKLVHQQEDVDDYTLLDLAVSSKGAGQLEMSRPVFFTITGNNLQNLLIDYNPVAVDRLSYRQSLINKQTNKQYGRLTFSTAFGSKGGSLVLRVINSRSDVTIDTISIELD